MSRRTLLDVIDDDESPFKAMTAAVLLAISIGISLAIWASATALAFRAHWLIGTLTATLPLVGVYHTLTKDPR